MFDLNFHIESVSPSSPAVAPQLVFRLAIQEGTVAAVQSILLKCQIRIEPARRRYPAEDPERLLDLFGTPDRWGKTMRSMLWTQVQAIVPAFAGETTVELAVPCTFDFNVAATKYFAALEEGEVPLVFLFSGTVFYQAEDGRLQVAPISLEKQADFRLPVGVWRQMMDHYYPRSTWLCLDRDVCDRLVRYKATHGLPTWEKAIESLLEGAGSPGFSRNFTQRSPALTSGHAGDSAGAASDPREALP